MQVKNNQYGFPCKTYWYIVDSENRIYHYKDNKWRKKSLMEIWTYAFRTEQEANQQLQKLNNIN